MGFSPADATELMRWMSRRNEATAPNRRGAPLQLLALRPATLATAIKAPPFRRADRQPERSIDEGGEPDLFRTRHDKPSTIYGSIASDFAVAFGVVAPMLSVWEVGRAVEAWRDQRVLHATPPVFARVIASDTVEGGRSSGLAKRVVLTFQPTPQSASCKVAVRIGFVSTQPEPGSAIAVVPRSDRCETPLIPSDIDDPEAAVMIAAGLMLGGLCSIKLWDRTYRKPPGHSPRLLRWERPRWGLFTATEGARVTAGRSSRLSPQARMCVVDGVRAILINWRLTIPRALIRKTLQTNGIFFRSAERHRLSCGAKRRNGSE